MVSEQIILKMVTLIRKYYLTDQKIELNSFVNEKEIEKLEFYYNTKWEHFKNEEDNIRIVGIQETKELSYKDQKRYKKLYYRFTKKKLLSCLYVSNEKEFIVIKKGGEYTVIVTNDLNELTDKLENSNYMARNKFADEKKKSFGEKWVIIPNVLYGNFETSLSKNYEISNSNQKSEVRKNTLNDWEGTKQFDRNIFDF
jgi:hypothetical protein